MKKNHLILIGILLLAAFLRVFGLNKIPPELFGDEVDDGYQAYSLLKTGRDYRGNFLPVYSESFAEPRAPLLFYATIPFEAVFGLNEWGVRLAPAFFGVLAILLTYWLVKEILAEEKVALIAVFLLTVSPWHLSYSRAAFEVSLLLFLVLLGTVSFLKALKGESKCWFWSAISFGLCFYAYSTANIFVPLWLLFLIYFSRSQLKKVWKNSSKAIVLALMIGGLVVLPLAKEILFGSAGFRFGLVSIFSDPQMVDQISFKRSVAPLTSLTERLFHNKVAFWFRAFWGNYLEALSFKFLFVSGDPNPRHSVPGFGLLFLAFFVPFLLGIFRLFQKNFREFFFFLAWLLIAPVPSSLTIGGGSHATRLFLILPPVIVFTAEGIYFLTKSKIGRWGLAGLSLVFIFEFFSYGHELAVHYPRETFRYWHYGYKQAILAYLKNKDRCSEIYLNNTHEPFLIRYLFWTKTDPAWFRQNFKGDEDSFQADGLFQGFSLGKAYFIRLTTPDKLAAIRTILSSGKSCYLAFQGDEVPGDWDLQKSPTEGIEVLEKVVDPENRPYIYLLH